MTPGAGKSYLEQCIAALPAERREAAWRAFDEISETGEDSYLSKLLAVLEANGAYARQIPKELTEAGARIIDGINQSLGQMGDVESRRRQLFADTVAAETARIAASLPVREINDRLGCLRDLAAKLEKLTEKIDTGVGSGAAVFWALFALMMGVAGTVWFFWEPYHEGRESKAFCDALAEAGIQARIEPVEFGTRLTIKGPLAAAAPLPGDSDKAAGVTLDFRKSP